MTSRRDDATKKKSLLVLTLSPPVLGFGLPRGYSSGRCPCMLPYLTLTVPSFPDYTIMELIASGRSSVTVYGPRSAPPRSISTPRRYLVTVGFNIHAVTWIQRRPLQLRSCLSGRVPDKACGVHHGTTSHRERHTDERNRQVSFPSKKHSQLSDDCIVVPSNPNRHLGKCLILELTV